MKRKLLLITTMLATISLLSQTYQQTDIELNSEIPRDKSVVFEASTLIKLMDGFRCDPIANKSAIFSIDRFGVFPPDDGVLGGPATSDHDGVVGALPGELNVSDMGASVYSIPILMPQGIGKMTPEIAVTYNNQAGNGLLGWGWDITGLSAIVRTGQTMYHDGNQTAVNFVDDRFMMDGKRLMLCSGDYGGHGSVYKTEIDEMSRIVAYTDGYNGPARLVVQKKDGTTWEYGCTNDSRVETQNDNKVVMMWLVNKIIDPDGNAIVFKYIENQSTGESYIKNIDYTLNNNAGIKSMYRVVFEYDDREDVETGYVFGNIVQKRKILKDIIIKNMMTGVVLYDYSFNYLAPGTYSNDFKFMYYRLSSIGLTANGLKLNPTVISWNKISHYPDKFQSYPLSQNVFNKVPFVGDFNGDGFSDVITVPYKLGNTYSANVQATILLNNGDGSFNESPSYTFNFDKTLEWVYVVDFNGDGLDDVVSYFANYDNNASWKSKIQAYINNGNGYTYIGEKKSTNRYFTIYPGDFCAERKVSFFLEYNNEGYSSSLLPAIVYYNDNSIVTQTFGINACGDVPDRITVEDINNDGRSEIIYMMENKSAVYQMSFVDNQYDMARIYYDNNIKSSDFLFPGDFNGDGYTDFLKYGIATNWEFIYSDGKRLQSPVSCTNNNLLQGLTLAPQDRYLCSLQSISIPSETIRTIDFDGDGKTDVGVFKSTGGNYYLEVGFNNFKDIRRFNLNINHSHQFIHIGNFLGQENVSILGSVRNNPYSNEIPKIVSLNPHSSKYSVERITNGIGNAHGFAYKYLMPDNSFYEFDYQWLGNDLRTVALPMKALCADTTFSTNNTPIINKYRYKNAIYHAKGHGLLGVERSETKLMINNALVETNMLEKDVEAMSENCMLLPKVKTKYNFNNVLISREDYVYIKCKSVQNDKVIMPLLTLRKVIDYDCDKANSILKTTIENIDYQTDIDDDNYCDIVNVGDVIVGYDDHYTGDDAVLCSYWSETDYEYENNPVEWIVNRQSVIRKSQRAKNSEIIGTFDVFEYSGNNPYQITHKIALPNLNMDFSDPLRIETDYKYDQVGHVVMQTLVSPSSKNQRVTRVNYGPEYNYRYLTSKINENGWENSISYDKDYGNVTSVLDYNQFETDSSTDPFEITTEKSLPDGMRSVKAKRWAEGNKHAPQNASYFVWEKSSGHAETMAFYSKNGNKLRDVTFGLNGEAIYTDITYDDIGNMLAKSMPYKAGDEVYNYYYVYDKNNRLIQEIHPNGLSKYYSYDKLQNTINTISSDGVSHVVVESMNAVGWRTQTIDIGGNAINYEYFSDGKLKNAMIGDNPATRVEYEYDNQRNVRKIRDLSKGETLYEYNAFGELKAKNTTNGTSTYEYDNMGNLIGRVETDRKTRKDVVTQWVYDNRKGRVGTLSKIICGDSQVVLYNYDDLLRMIDVTEVINGADYTTKYTYDNANRQEFVTYPSGVIIKKKYSNSGHYKCMTDPKEDVVLWQTEAADAMGFVTDYQVGNGVTTHQEYDPKSGRLCSVFTNSTSNVLQDLTYSYDDFGNLTSRAKMTGTKQLESFKYDNFNRLEEIRLNNTVKGVINYDNYGNIQSKVNDGEEVFYEAHYEGNSPYAVSKVKTDMPDFSGMNQTIEYAAFDKMAYVEAGNNTLSIEYGYDYSRIHSVEHVDGRKKDKVYVSDCEYIIDNGKKIIFTYLSGPMGVFAVCRTSNKGESDIFYIHKDHLDSWCLVTDENGKALQKTSYDAWGNPRNENSWSGSYTGELLCDRGFTGHEHLSAFGIINMNGRAYDPVMSMMMSPDDYIQNLDFSQNFNRYIYCYNNPLSYCDPSGEWVEWLLYGLYNGVVNVIYNLDNIDSFAEGALSFGAGFISGCLTEGLSSCSWVWQVAGKVTSVTLQKGVNSFVKYNTGSGLDASVLEGNEFKSDLMYGFSSGLVSGLMNSYITQPTDGKEGVSLGSLLCSNKAERKLIENTTAKIAGNLFSGRYMFHGLELTKDNWKEVVPYFKCVMGVAANGIEFEGHSGALGNVFDKLLNFDFSGFMNKFGSDSNYCYSQIRSLFVKNGG